MGLLTPLAVRIGAIPWMPRLLPQIVWTTTANGELDYCNRRWSDFTGTS